MVTDYWKRWPVTVSWAEPGEVVGTIVAFGDLKEKHPQMTIRTPDGLVLTLNITQARLHERLAQLAPQEGDKIRIRYIGDSDKSLPNMSPTKLFTVEVWPQSPQSLKPIEATPGEVNQLEGTLGTGGNSQND